MDLIQIKKISIQIQMTSFFYLIQLNDEKEKLLNEGRLK